MHSIVLLLVYFLSRQSRVLNVRKMQMAAQVVVQGPQTKYTMYTFTYKSMYKGKMWGKHHISDTPPKLKVNQLH
jgi:hypothetical protein